MSTDVIMYFKIPEFRLFDFVKFTELVDISILVAIKDEDLFTNQIYGYIRLNKNPNIPTKAQQEKLTENFGKFVKPA